MPSDAVGITVTATKMASGNVQFVITMNNAIRDAFVLTSANVTSINTTVNGGATGAALSFVLAQDANLGDYPFQYTQGI